MIAIAISLLIGFAAFVAIMVVTVSVSRGLAEGKAILAELAEIDARTGITRQRVAQPRLFASA